MAAALRWLRDSDLPPWAGYTYEVVMGYMPKVGEGSVYQESTYKEYVARLADLIDPEERKGLESDAFGLEALLALADEMERRAPYALHGGWRDSLRDYARRIREACGVVS